LRNIIEYACQDIDTAKRWIRTSGKAPVGFPESEWGNLLRGKTVNLHKMLSEMHIVRPCEENVGHMGNLEFKVPNDEVAKRVKTASDWQSAWTATVKATIFVFPH
jgi:hypothetical protein